MFSDEVSLEVSRLRAGLSATLPGRTPPPFYLVAVQMASLTVTKPSASVLSVGTASEDRKHIAERRVFLGRCFVPKKRSLAQIHSLPREWPELDLTFTADIFEIRESPLHQDLCEFWCWMGSHDFQDGATDYLAFLRLQGEGPSVDLLMSDSSFSQVRGQPVWGQGIGFPRSHLDP